MRSVFELPLWAYYQQQELCVATQGFPCKLQTAPYNSQNANANANANALQLYDYWKLKGKLKVESGKRKAERGKRKVVRLQTMEYLKLWRSAWVADWIRYLTLRNNYKPVYLSVSNQKWELFQSDILPNITHFNNSLFGYILQTYITLSLIEKSSNTGNTMVKLLSATTLLALLSFGYVK